MLCEADYNNNMAYTIHMYNCVCMRVRASPFLIHNWTVVTVRVDAGRKIEFNCEIFYKLYSGKHNICVFTHTIRYRLLPTDITSFVSNNL